MRDILLHKNQMDRPVDCKGENMTYVISDLHGISLKKFQDLLACAGFSDEDDLFVLGDTIDRGENGVELLLWMMEQANVFHLLGNHEAMLLSVAPALFKTCEEVVTNKKTKIGERAFENCATLSEVSLPDGMTELYGGVFNSCKSLKKIKLPQNLTVLGESAFSDCVGLESIEIPETVTKIDDLVFNGCTSLAKVDLMDGLKKIGKGAFKNCKSLTKITIPETVTSMSDALFRGCEALKTIKVSPRNKHYKSAPNKRDGNDRVLFNKNKSMLIAYPAASRELLYDIPDSVTVISDWAFCECKKLNRVFIPDSVHEIGEGAFCNCILLDEVEIPDSVTKLDDCVFRGCTSLEKVVIPDSVKELGWGLFDGCENIVTVYCNEGSAAYEYCLQNDIREARIAEKEAD